MANRRRFANWPQIAGVSEGVLRGMVGAGLLEPVTVDLDRPYPRALPDHAVPDLSDDQQAAADRFVDAVREAAVRAIPARRRYRLGQDRMLFRSHGRSAAAGAAGAGPAARNRADPELPAPVSRRVSARRRCCGIPARSSKPSGGGPGARSPPARHRSWSARARRCSCPTSALGLIVVDEAHEVSFKQDDGVRYNARDVAVIRARFESVPVILASATPALESMQLAEAGVYTGSNCPTASAARPCPTSASSTCAAKQPERGRWLAPRLVEEMRERLARGEQSAAVPQPPRLCPADAVPPLRLPLPVPQLHAWLVEHRLSRRSPATTAVTKFPRPMPAPNAARPIASSPAARGWSGSPMKWPNCCPKRASRRSRPTR
jgi:primosomal protein N' (replication factor Y)